MANTIQIPPIRFSPSSLQYSRQTRQKIKPYYTPRFKIASGDARKTLYSKLLRSTDPLMPPYPYGVNVNFKEANQGLYGGASVQSGNKISKGRNKGKTLRKWFPNVRVEKIRSEALNQELVLPIRARTLRTIKKCGGLDEYLLGEKPARIKELGLTGWKLRWLVLNSKTMQRRHEKERQDLGLNTLSPLMETFEEVWNDKTRRQELVDEQESAWQKLRDKVYRFERTVQDSWSAADKFTYLPRSITTLMQHSPKGMVLPDLEVEGNEETDKIEGTKGM